jgi:glutamyl-tRNA synthetase
MTVRTRFAPSPTGSLHIGGVRTALFSWLYARRYGGEYILRIEDTDRERSTDAGVEIILEAFDWLGLKPDEGPFFQSRRFDRYREVADGMLQAATAYRCYCTPEELAEMRAQQTARGEKPRYDGRCRGRAEPRPGVAPAVRFRNPDSGQVVVDDLVHGKVVFENSELDDFVLLRSDGTPTYHFGVVVDDADMRITHVIRGDDHLNNTPRHINLFRALGYEPPQFAHIPMIAGPDGAKLSKRHGAVSVLEYRELGYLPDAVLNYLARLGWSHGDQEIFSRDELVRLFDLGAVQRSAARFDLEKLNWLNQHYIKETPVLELAAELVPHLAAVGVSGASPDRVAAVADAFRERAKTLRDMAEKARVYLTDEVAYEPKAVQKQLQPSAEPLLRALRAAFAELAAWTAETTQGVVERVAADAGVGLGKVAQPLRVALTGDVSSPGIGATLSLVGRERTLTRIDRALDLIRSASSAPA